MRERRVDDEQVVVVSGQEATKPDGELPAAIPSCSHSPTTPLAYHPAARCITLADSPRAIFLPNAAARLIAYDYSDVCDFKQPYGSGYTLDDEGIVIWPLLPSL